MNTQRQLLLGIFFIVALSILAFYTLFLTDIHLFSKPVLMTVYFPEANNLREGDPVQLLGARIGRVKEVTPHVTADKDKRILTVLSLDEEIELVEDATISIRETSLLGGRNVFIDPGTPGGPLAQPLPDGAYLGTVYKNPITMLGDIGTLFNENRESITKAFLNIETITSDISQGKGLIGKLVVDESLAADAKEVVAESKSFMANAREASEQLRSGQGLAATLLYDEGVKQKFGDTLDNLRQLSADLKSGQGLLGALIYDSTLKDRLTSGIDSFVDFSEKLNRGEGTLGLLMNDPDTREEARALISNMSRASDDLRVLVADAREGRGTLGKLITDDALYEELRRTVAIATRSLEDYREAAPITAFTSVLFAAF